MKIIFLDFDGVLNNPGCYERGSGNKVPPEPSCIAALNHLTDVTEARIVVSSSWRLGETYQLSVMAALLEEWGVTGRILGVTPKLVGASRGDEIQAWIQLNKGTKYQAKQFVILDDDTDMGKLKSNLVQTQGHVGLTMADAEKAIAMLL